MTAIYVDADACPVKAEVTRVAGRHAVKVFIVSNGGIRPDPDPLVETVIVPDGPDVADMWIADRAGKGDICITGDIPLAARVVEKSGIAIGTRGQLYDEASVHGRLATRNLMEQLRSSGVETGGPKPLDRKDVQAFANQLDKILTRLLKLRRR